MAGPPKLNVICLGQQDWYHCWTGKQHLTSRRAGRGHRVLYVDPTWSYEDGGLGHRLCATAPSLSGVDLREEAEGLHMNTYTNARLLRWRLNRWRWPRSIRAVVDRLGFSNVEGEKRKLRRQEESLLRDSDLALATSEHLHRRRADSSPSREGAEPSAGRRWPTGASRSRTAVWWSSPGAMAGQYPPRGSSAPIRIRR